MNSTVKTVIFWLVIVLSAFLLWQVMKAGSAGQKEKEVNFSQFLSDIDQGNVKEVTITGMEVRGKYRNDNSAFHTTAPVNYPDIYKMLRDKGVTMNIRDITSGSWPLQLLGTWAPLILLAAAVVFHDPADADRGKQGAFVWQEPGPAALHAAEKGHLQGRGRRR